MVTSFDLLALLDSVGSDYPGGIPRGGIPAGAAVGKGTTSQIRCSGPTSAPLVFLGFGGAGALLDGVAGGLLEAAVQKGLKIDPAVVAFISLPQGIAVDDVAATLKNFTAPVGVALGPEVGRLLGIRGPSGEWSEIDGRAWRVTVALDAVLADAGLKRPLWNDLQAVGQRLATIKG